MRCLRLAGPWPVENAENDLGINDIFIARNNPIIRPPNLRVNTTIGYFSFVPSYNCTVGSSIVTANCITRSESRGWFQNSFPPVRLHGVVSAQEARTLKPGSACAVRR